MQSNQVHAHAVQQLLLINAANHGAALVQFSKIVKA